LTFGEDWGWGASKEVSQQLFELYANAGGNFIDTAVNYTNGTAEKYVGDFITSDRAHFVVATKYTLSTRSGDPNASGNHRKNMMQSAEKSLTRLKTDYIDIYWLHAWDGLTPVEEIMRAFDDLVRAGKVLYIGISDTPAWVVSQANMLADLRGWSCFVALQTRYSLADRAAERDLLPMARALDLAITPWSVLSAGLLTGKYNSGDAAQGRATTWQSIPDKPKQIAETVMAVAQDAGCTPSQVALNWVRQQPGVIIPLLGATKVAQLQDNLNCLNHTLSPEHLERLNTASAIELGFPHDFLAGDNIRNIVFSGQYEQIDKHRPG
jgi:aryl-alcohol dehydrogenase-like predicted oxidoreductase